MTTSVGSVTDREVIPTLGHSLLIGGLGFAIVSLFVFATVAFGERWMYKHLGLLGAYLGWTGLFILCGGAVLGSLVVGRWRLPKFYLLFGSAFFLYAVGWVGAYSIFPGVKGEWLGSLAGSVLMTLVLAVAFGATRIAPKLSALLFVANSLGYFAGSALNSSFGGRAGMLSWGVAYGFCLGAGLGAILHFAQLRHAGKLAAKGTSE
jgi:hypothetical protein